MLQILDEKERRTTDSIENQYKDCKYILTNYTDLEEPEGYLYCVSSSDDSFTELFDVADRLEDAHIPFIIMGSYNRGGAPFIQYEIKE
ncbi:MAG: hypothetical protein IJP92_11895 [Lachnospiraceae bacterium]|nr:hypothetical protein [Lachnospiraceae bacterium]